MRKVVIFLSVLMMLTGCQWQEKRNIEKTIVDHYQNDICAPWQEIIDKSNKAILVEAGLLEEKTGRVLEGIMGYALEKKYAVTDIAKGLENDDGEVCYGITNVDDVKNITFEGSDKAVVSFVIGETAAQEWAQHLLTQKGKILRRSTVMKSANGKWIVAE